MYLVINVTNVYDLSEEGKKTASNTRYKPKGDENKGEDSV